MPLELILLIAILLLIGLGLFVYLIILLIQRPRINQSRIDDYVAVSDEISSAQLSQPNIGDNNFDRIDDIREWINRSLTIFSSGNLKHKLSSAYWPITDVEFVSIRYFIFAIGFLFGWVMTRSLIGGIILGIIMYLIPEFLLQQAISKRQKLFQDQLIDVLILIRGAIQAGYGLLQSLDVVVSEMASPSSEEFGRVIREVQIGYSLNQALTNLANRMGSDDLQLVVTSIVINNQVGGNLSTMLTAVTNTIRARYQLFGEVRASTSYARYAGYLLTFLPFGTGLAMFFLSPDTYAESLQLGISQIILAGAGVLVFIGNIWLRRISHIEV